MIAQATDLRDILFAGIGTRVFTARVTTEGEGIVAGSSYAEQKLRDNGIGISFMVPEGTRVVPGDLIAEFSGSAKQITMAEEYLIGDMAKVSGIATAAARAVTLAGETCRVASGSWKKMPPEIKDAVRQAIVLGGASPRLVGRPFVYLDKNYVRIFGGIAKALAAAAPLADHVKVIQLKGETGTIGEETREAAAAGADVVMVDTGRFGDAAGAVKTLEALASGNAQGGLCQGPPLRGPAEVRRLRDRPPLHRKAIIDAPLMDMKLDIVAAREGD